MCIRDRDYNEYVGRIGIGKVHSGTLKVNEMVSCVRLDGSIKDVYKRQ